MNLSWQISKESIRSIQESLKSFERKMAKKILRKGAREWTKATEAALKAAIPHNDKEMRKSVTFKVKTLKKNKGIWMGVGFRSAVRVGEGIDSHWIATRARWYNDGWTAYPKGRKSGRKGKDWRKGLRGVGGTKVYHTEFVYRTADRMLPTLEHYIIQSIQEAIKEQGTR